MSLIEILNQQSVQALIAAHEGAKFRNAAAIARQQVRDRKRKQRSLDRVLGRRADGSTIRPIKEVTVRTWEPLGSLSTIVSSRVTLRPVSR